MMLWPVREALGLAQGIESVRRLFGVTVGCTLLLTPLFGWLVSRVPRRRLFAVSARLCALFLLGFYAGLTLLPGSMRVWVAGGYYVFHSVLNLFLVSLFWALMADRFSMEESKRFFPPIALGGTLGAILGSTIACQLARRIGVGPLFLLAVLLLELAVWLAVCFARSKAEVLSPRSNEPVLGGASLDGIHAVRQSVYIQGISLGVVMSGVISTLLYFTGLRLVAAEGVSIEHQTVLFARINLWTQLAILGAQAFMAARIMRRAGVGMALATLPILAVGGFGVLVWAPTLLVFTWVNAAFRAAQQGIASPAQETLFTVLRPREKYQAKSFIDTFGLRAGDATGGLLEKLLTSLAPGLLLVAAVVSIMAAGWLALCVFLGRAQNRLANPALMFRDQHLREEHLRH